MVKIGLLGLGTVGSGVVRILNNQGEAITRKLGTELLIKRVLVNEKGKKREVDLPPGMITDSAAEVLEDPEIDLVVELIGGEEPARQYIIQALQRGKSVVTANKLVIARHGQEISKLAREKGVQVCFEGSVAGGIPVIQPLKESFAANRIEALYGILNGTTNYILSQMTAEGRDFAAVLKEAQRLGYAENDPSSDIGGADAAYKIAILASIAFETAVDYESVYVEGIEKIELEDIQLADELGYVIKLLAVARNSNGNLDLRVHPAFVPQNHPLALVSDVYNAVYLHGDAVGEVMSYGRGAGQMPTASAVVADIIQAGKMIFNHREPDYLTAPLKYPVLGIEEVENSFYLRLKVNDKPGVLAKIAGILGENRVSLASVIQKHRLSPVVPIVLITHPIKEKHLQNSLMGIKELEDVVEITSMIRVAAL